MAARDRRRLPALRLSTTMAAPQGLPEARRPLRRPRGPLRIPPPHTEPSIPLLPPFFPPRRGSLFRPSLRAGPRPLF